MLSRRKQRLGEAEYDAAASVCCLNSRCRDNVLAGRSTAGHILYPPTREMMTLEVRFIQARFNGK
jgi:hypothetical protein